MREIKFRAWDEQTKKHWAIDRWHVGDEYIDLIPVGVSVSDPNIERIWRHTRDLILEQYTGVKDLNGQEVYEGDVLIDPDDNRVYGVVTFYDGAFSANGGYLYDEADGTYVGGNIHENPELLEGE